MIDCLNRRLCTLYMVDIQVVSWMHILLWGLLWCWLLVEQHGYSPSFLSARLRSLSSAAWHLDLGEIAHGCHDWTSVSQKWTWSCWGSAIALTPTGRKRRRAGKGGDLSLVPYAKNLLPEETVKTQTSETRKCTCKTVTRISQGRSVATCLSCKI